jgi:hypothetical protein
LNSEPPTLFQQRTFPDLSKGELPSLFLLFQSDPPSLHPLAVCLAAAHLLRATDAWSAPVATPNGPHDARSFPPGQAGFQSHPSSRVTLAQGLPTALLKWPHAR